MRKLLPTILLVVLLFIPTSALSTLPEIEITTTENETISLKNFQGEPFLFLAMSTSCSSCKLQNTYLKEVNSATSNMSIISIAMDPMLDNLQSIKQYKQEQEIPWIVTIDQSGELKIMYKIQSFPSLFFVDATGNIVKNWKYVVETDEIIETIDDYVEVGEVTKEKNPIVAMLFNNWFFRITAGLIILIIPAKKIYSVVSNKTT